MTDDLIKRLRPMSMTPTPADQLGGDDLPIEVVSPKGIRCRAVPIDVFERLTTERDAEFKRGVKESFDWLLTRTANHYHGNPKVQATCDIQNEWLRECAIEMLAELSPADHSEWFQIVGLLKKIAALTTERDNAWNSAIDQMIEYLSRLAAYHKTPEHFQQNAKYLFIEEILAEARRIRALKKTE